VAAGERRYVVDIDPAEATVVIGSRDDLRRDCVRVVGLSFVGQPPGSRQVDVQVRAHGATARGRLDGDVVRFVAPQPRVAPGQVVALYDGDALVGGGIAA